MNGCMAADYLLSTCTDETSIQSLSCCLISSLNICNCRSDPRLSIVGRGTLVIAQTKPGDAGQYRCKADNDVGRPQTASATITVLGICALIPDIVVTKALLAKRNDSISVSRTFLLV